MSSALTMAQGINLSALVASYERGLTPLSEQEPGGMSPRDPSKAGKLSTALGDALALIATKINPTMSTEQADAWVKVMVVSLSDLPGRVAREATEAALRRPIRFFPEADGIIREEADKIGGRHRTALRRLRMMQEEIARAAGPKPALPAPDLLERISAEEIRRMTPTLRRIGLTQGWMTQAEVDEALGITDSEQAEAA